MREGNPHSVYGDRGLHVVHPGGGSQPMLMRLYGEGDQLLASLTEERGRCIDPGYVDFFLGPNCRPARYEHALVEILPDGTKNVVHPDPAALGASREARLALLSEWVNRHTTPQAAL